MDADEIERIINEQLNKIILSEEDLDNYEEEDLTLDLSEDDRDNEVSLAAPANFYLFLLFYYL